MPSPKKVAHGEKLLSALSELGGKATTQQVAELTGLPMESVNSSFCLLYSHVTCVDGKRGQTEWILNK